MLGAMLCVMFKQTLRSRDSYATVRHGFYAEGSRAMSARSWKRTRLVAGAALVSVMGTGLTASAAAPENSAPPDFSSNLAGWIGLDGAGPFFEAVPGVAPGPVISDPAHPFVPNGTDKQPTFRIADLSNPNL